MASQSVSCLPISPEQPLSQTKRPRRPHASYCLLHSVNSIRSYCHRIWLPLPLRLPLCLIQLSFSLQYYWCRNTVWFTFDILCVFTFIVIVVIMFDRDLKCFQCLIILASFYLYFLWLFLMSRDYFKEFRSKLRSIRDSRDFNLSFNE